jgi:hypothetical protein
MFITVLPDTVPTLLDTVPFDALKLTVYVPVPVHKALPTLRFGTCVHVAGTGQLGAVTTKVVTSPQLVVEVKVALPDDTVTVLPLMLPLLVVTVALLLKVTVYPEPVPEHVMFCTVNTGFEHATHTGADTTTLCGLHPGFVTVKVTVPVKLAKLFALEVTVVPAIEVV